MYVHVVASSAQHQPRGPRRGLPDPDLRSFATQIK